jgi:hydroxylamine reductase
VPNIVTINCNFGDIGGIPRVLDAGQCNDSYSLAVIALKLKEVFGLDDINDLPIVYNIAWYEQKAVIVLLALLHLRGEEDSPRANPCLHFYRPMS